MKDQCIIDLNSSRSITLAKKWSDSIKKFEYSIWYSYPLPKTDEHNIDFLGKENNIHSVLLRLKKYK